MKPPEVHEALAPVTEALDALGVGYYVGGSVASSAHGVPRASLDVDLLAELRLEHVARFVAASRTVITSTPTGFGTPSPGDVPST